MNEEILYHSGTQLLRLIKVTLHAYRKFSRVYVEGENISVTGLQILSSLRSTPNIDTVSELANKLDVSKGLVSREVEVLRKSGYVNINVDTSDRRVLHIECINEKAEPVILKQNRQLYSLIYQMVGDMSEEELKSFTSLMEVAYKNILEADINKQIDIENIEEFESFL